MRPDEWPRQPTAPSRWTWKFLHSWKWKHSGYITELEMRSALTASRWRAQSLSPLRTRFVLFIDNQSSLAVLFKSRSSSRKPNAVARKAAAILLCTLSRNLCAYTGKDGNPADGGSRRQHAPSKSSHRKDATVSVVLNALSSQHRLQSRRQKGSVTAVACTVAYALLLQRCSCRVSTWLHDEGQSPSHDKGGLDAPLCEYLECGRKERTGVGQVTRSVCVSFSCKRNAISQLRETAPRLEARGALLQAPPPTGPIGLALIALAWNSTDVAVLTAISYVVFCERWKRSPCNVTKAQHTAVAIS